MCIPNFDFNNYFEIQVWIIEVPLYSYHTSRGTLTLKWPTGKLQCIVWLLVILPASALYTSHCCVIIGKTSLYLNSNCTCLPLSCLLVVLTVIAFILLG